MPRAFLKTKNRGGHKTYSCTVCGKPIEAGEDYYTWKFNRGGRYFQHATHGHPRRSQLSNSKMAEVWDAVDTLDLSSCETPDDIKQALESVAQTAREVSEQYIESADNIEQSFPSGNPTSEACRTTGEELESWADTLESWDPDEDEFVKDDSSYDDEESWLEAQRESAMDVVNEQPEYQG